MQMKDIALDDWARSLLVDPVGKSPLEFRKDAVCSDYGRCYPIRDGIIDFRPFSASVGEHADTWETGQMAYESWSDTLAQKDSLKDYEKELNSVRDVYEAIPIQGACLDVGGHQGRLRAFLAPEQKYMVVDPYISVFDGISSQPNLLKAYPFLTEPVNFVCGVAEHLPVQASSFDVVHMRSVIDHFQNPALALLEAYRVLKASGYLVIGLFVEGGETGRLTLTERTKEILRTILPWFGITKWTDHHVWHPTYAELVGLIQASGFAVDQVYWQKQFVDRVCYIKAYKQVPGDTQAKRDPLA